SFIGDIKTVSIISLTPRTDHVPVRTMPVTYTAVAHDANAHPAKGGTISWTTHLNTFFIICQRH
ncbi:hypothetical protein, partial [Salmonella enterica]|uniref:hypothetical protein n=1 Tax=Salmonella enterica TaxID=28901 RepID=UPI00196010A5